MLCASKPKDAVRDSSDYTHAGSHMPLARILNSSPEDAASLATLLRELGYEVEFGGAEQGRSAADVEVEVELCGADDALRRGVQIAARIGADLFVAPGALTNRPEPAAARPKSAIAAEIETPQPTPDLRPFDVVAPAELNPQAAPSRSDFVAAEHEPAATESVQSAQPATDPAIAYGSIFGSLYPSQSQSAACKRVEVREWEVPEVAEPSGSRLMALLDSASNAAGVVMDAVRDACNEAADGIAQLVRQWRAHRVQRRQLRAQSAQLRRAASEQKSQRRSVAQPAITCIPVATVAAAAPLPRPATTLQSARRAPRRGSWAMLAVAVTTAACALFAWLTLADQDLSPPATNGRIEQQLPFGPVTITPKLPATPAPAPAVSAPAITAPSVSRAPQTSPPPQRRRAGAAAPQRHRPSRRAQSNFAEDDVTVRHFDAPKPTTGVVASRNHPKRITDIE
jgi:hypothetical protein